MSNKYKICIISSQIFGFGKVGGFGSMTRKLAEALIKAGHDVSVVTHRKGKQESRETINGISIYGLSIKEILFQSRKLFADINADIYHSQNPNLLTYLAMQAEPGKKHVITCRDPRDTKDWLIEMRFATWKRRLKTPFVYFFEAGPFISYAIKKADIVGCPAHFLRDKVTRMYGRKDVMLLPNLEDLPSAIPQKAKEPAVCFVGRLDRRKRPELAFRLAEKFPGVNFIIVGIAEDNKRQIKLEQAAAKLKNVKMLGYVDRFKSDTLQQVYGDAWILLNTSAREALPITFIEAAGHGCAILSTVNPDNFAIDFGYYASSPNGIEEGLSILISNNNWRSKGEAGYKYSKELYEYEKASRIHNNTYLEVVRS